ncbi:MAG: hypothetical protein CVT94_14420 [Bacteroidetes bacterium HGW-Bacteroidetes-11]|jgi:thioredoxin|nr:MAG: hypothetical protein CVT94_14420 [Bacteroidetes bacterium HGW-Bacteroidetes-11]
MRNFQIIISLFLFLTLSSCAQETEYIQLNAIDFQNISSTRPGILLDVRTLGEYKNGHIENSGQLNYYASDFRGKLLLLPKNQPVYLYCNTGYRSERAAKILAANGYSQVYNLEKGIMEWNLKNLPVIVDPDASPDKENMMDLATYNSLINTDSLVLIDFYAPWCAPCRKMMPMVDSLKTEYHGSMNIVKINADASKKLIKELKIESVPYFALYRNGMQLFSHYGFIGREELVKRLNQHIVQ